MYIKFCKAVLFAVFVLLSTLEVSAQFITTSPAFPKETDTVTITFDAALGSQGLKDCSCEVYAHTGVITSKSTSLSDWKYVKYAWGVNGADAKMTSIGNNKYTLTIVPRTYYKVPSGETIQQMAFVFRSADSRKEGKDTGGKDVFVAVSPANAGFQVAYKQPANRTFLATANTSIPVQVQASVNATFSIFQDQVLAQTVQQQTEASLTLPAGGVGDHTIEVRVASGDSVTSTTYKYVVPGEQVVAALPAGLEMGANEVNDSTVTLRLFAPEKQHVFVVGSFSDYFLSSSLRMKRDPDGENFWITLPVLTPGSTVYYQYLVDGTLRIADPYSTLVADPIDDTFIPNTGLPAYPREKASGTMSVLKPAKKTFAWQHINFKRPAKEGLVIYELLMRDFLHTKQYTALLDTLQYLKSLGVNAIEFMPIQEFEGNLSWGYNPSYHMALDKYYGTPDDFKRVVDACHGMGIAVIVDVVYNHAFSQSPLARLYWDESQFRPSTRNPWLNPTPKHPFNVGYDFNHESNATKAFLDRVMKFWITEYNIDGFRFDLSKGFTQKDSGSDVGLWSAYDASRIAILKRIYQVCTAAATPNYYLILEHFGSPEEERELAEFGFMFWGNATKDYQESAMGYPENSNFRNTYFGFRNWTKPHLVSYMESHDEERVMYKVNQFGYTSAGYKVKGSLPTAFQRLGLNAAFFYTVPGPKMLWQFGELGYDYSINQCKGSSTISDGCRLDEKPLPWGYLADAERKKLYETTAKIINLRTQNPIFQFGSVSGFTGTGAMRRLHLTYQGSDVIVIGNAGVSFNTGAPQFTKTGWWYDLMTGDSLQVQNQGQVFPFQAGEYRIWSSSKLTTSLRKVEQADLGLQLFPNPGTGLEAIRFISPVSTQGELAVYALNGALVFAQNQQVNAGLNQYFPNIELTPGVYTVRVTLGTLSQSQRLIIVK